MKTNNRFRRVVAAMAATAAVLTLAACSAAAPGPDAVGCVYDKNDALVKTLAPSSDEITLGSEQYLVRIPVSDRFYNVTRDDATRDALAPVVYDRAFARGNVAMFLEGKTRFRFNESLACDWFAKHGRRNAPSEGEFKGDLQFNARGEASLESPWFRYLAENFGDTMQKTSTEVMGSYDWAPLTFNYPENANEQGILPEGEPAGKSSREALEKDLGERFTQNLNESLGGNYFCGVGGSADECPPITFEILKVEPQNAQLVTDRQAVEDAKSANETAQQLNELNQLNAEALIQAEQSKRQLLAEQVETAELQARIDTAKCRQLGTVGLDCNGNRPGAYTVVDTGRGSASSDPAPESSEATPAPSPESP